jgi:hypothetical protein
MPTEMAEERVMAFVVCAGLRLLALVGTWSRLMGLAMHKNSPFRLRRKVPSSRTGILQVASAWRASVP